MMQTAEFFYHDQDKQVSLNDEDYKKKNVQKQYIETKQDTQIDIKEKQLTQKSFQKKKKNIHSRNKCLTQQDESEYFSLNYDKNIASMIQNFKMKQNKTPWQNQKQDKIVDFQNEESFLKGDKQRRLSLALDGNLNEEVDTLFWEKINQIVNSSYQIENKNSLYTQNRFHKNILQHRPNIQSSLLAGQLRKTERFSKKQIKSNLESSENSLKDIVCTEPSYPKTHSLNQSEMNIELSQSKQPYLVNSSMKNFNLQGQLPLLNIRLTKNPDFKQQNRNLFSSSCKDYNMISQTILKNERNILNNQIAMRHGLQSQQNLVDKSLKSDYQNVQVNKQKMNMLNIHSSQQTSPKNRIQSQEKLNFQLNNQSCKNIIQSKNMMKLSSEFQSINNNLSTSIQNQKQSIHKNSNNLIFEVPTLQSNREFQPLFFKQQEENCDQNEFENNIKQIGNNDLIQKTNKSQNKQNESLIKQAMRSQKNEENKKIHNNLDLILKKVDIYDVNDKAESKKIPKEQQQKIQNLMKMNDQYNQNLLIKPQFEQKEIYSKDLKHNQTKQNGKTQTMRKSMELSDLKQFEDIKILNSSPSVRIGLKDITLNGESKQNIINSQQNQNMIEQKSRIKSCFQTQTQNEEFSFCYDSNKLSINKSDINEPAEENIQGYNQNDQIQIKSQKKKQHNLNFRNINSKQEFESLLQTTNFNNKFNLKCKQQQNVVKKIFNFDIDQKPSFTSADSMYWRRQQNKSSGSKIYQLM